MTYAQFKALCFPNASGRHGAPMGRRSYKVGPMPAQLHRRQVPINRGGYDPGGAYWGTGLPLYCTFSTDGSYRHYTRGTTAGYLFANK